MKLFFPRLFFAAYGTGALTLAFFDYFFPQLVSTGTSWGPAPGWLREIAGFNIFVAILCFVSLRNFHRPTLPQTIAGALGVLSALLASNNMVAYLQGHLLPHFQAALTHMVGFFAALTTVTILRKVPG